MPADDLISVIVPAHNVERYIGRTLASALGQTYDNIEVIVVDDGSTDATVAVVDAMARQDRRIRLLRSANVGVSAARNLAIANAKGALIAPLDGDDLWRSDKLARQLTALRSAGPKTGVVYTWSACIDEGDRVILPGWNDSFASGNVLHAIVIGGIVGNGSTPLIRREYIEAVGGYDESAALRGLEIDTELAGVCEFAVVPEYLTGYRFRADSASLNVLEMEVAVDRVTAWIENNWPSLPGSVFRDRKYTVEAYLAFLAIRQRYFLHALRYLGEAACARPAKLFTHSYLRLFALLFAHLIGLRTYRWTFWHKAAPFDISPP